MTKEKPIHSRSLSSFMGVKESGYGRVKVEVSIRDNIAFVKVPTGQYAVVPKADLCKLFRKYNFEADGVTC
ncbi:MAG: hypothetical protein F7C32_00885 [Desulfurococcales archaeon]|nr:hypothetical protein [Desulfurococcales archaeon]